MGWNGNVLYSGEIERIYENTPVELGCLMEFTKKEKNLNLNCLERIRLSYEGIHIS